MTELRKQINNIVEDYNACKVLAESVGNPSIYDGTTATEEDIKIGKTAYSNGKLLTGTLQGTSQTVFSDVEPEGENRALIWIKGSKNLINTSVFHKLNKSGITLTVEDDGSVTFNGTCTDWSCNLFLSFKWPEELLGQYVTFGFVGSDKLMTDGTQVYPGFRTSTPSDVKILYEDPWNGLVFQVTEDIMNQTATFGFYVPKGASYNNDNLKVMMVVGQYWDSTTNNFTIPYEKHIIPEIYILDENNTYQTPNYYTDNISKYYYQEVIK